MENIDERLRLLEQTGCSLSGFTVNNATQEQFERFLTLFAKADALEQLNITLLEDFSKDLTDDETWQKRKERSLKYRFEHKIILNEEVVGFFYNQVLPNIINLLASKKLLKSLYLFNVMLNGEQKLQMSSIFENHKTLQKVEFGNLHLQK